MFRKFSVLHCNPTIQLSDFNFRFASVHLYLLNFYLDLYLTLSNFKLQFLSVNFYLLKMPECVVCQDVEGSYAFHDQHFVCSGCRECWIAVLDRENARVIRATLEVKCSVCRKVCILRKGRRSSSVDLFFGFRIRLLFKSFIRIITTYFVDPATDPPHHGNNYTKLFSSHWRYDSVRKSRFVSTFIDSDWRKFKSQSLNCQFPQRNSI